MQVVGNVVSLGAALQCVLRDLSLRALSAALLSPLAAQSGAVRDSLRALALCEPNELGSILLRHAAESDEQMQRVKLLYASGVLRCGEAALCAALRRVDDVEARRRALLALQLVRERVRTLRMRHDACVNVRSNALTAAAAGAGAIVELDGASLAVVAVRDDVVKLVPELCAACVSVCIDDDGDVVAGVDDVSEPTVRRRADESCQLRATRLRVLAFNVALDAAQLLAQTHSPEQSVRSADSVADMLGADGVAALQSTLRSLLRSLPSVMLWFERPRPLFAFALVRLERLLRAIVRRNGNDSSDDDDDDDSRGRVALAVYYLAFFPTYAMSDSESVRTPARVVATVQSLLGSVYHPLQPLAGPPGVSEDELAREAEELSFRACIGVCLALGQLGERALRDALRDVPAARLLDVAVGQFHGPAQSVTARVAAQLACVAIGAVQQRDAAMLLEPLTELLQHSQPQAQPQQQQQQQQRAVDLLQRDNVGDAAAMLLARVIATIGTPGAMRHALTRLLDTSGDKVRAAMARHNAILLLEHLLNELDCAAAGELVRELTMVLLERLADEQVQLRSAAAQLFGQLPSSFIVPELVRRAVSRDVPLRAAAERALLEHMQRLPASALAGALLLVQSCVVSAAAAPLSPSSSAPQESVDDGAAGDVAARVFRTLPQWLAALSAAQAQAVVEECVAAAQRDERSPAGARMLGGVLRALPHAAPLVAQLLARKLREQGALSEAVLASVCDDAERLGALLFARVAPLLLLRALPPRALTTAPALAAAEALEEPLCARVDNALEFEQVRKLAAELLARLPPQLVLRRALPLLGASADTGVAKAYLFVVLNTLALADRRAASVQQFAPAVVERLVGIFARPTASGEVEQLQRGAMECLACLINVVALGGNAGAAAENDDIEQPKKIEIAAGSSGGSMLQIVKQQHNANGDIDDVHSGMAATAKRTALIVELDGDGSLVERMLERVVGAGDDTLQVRLCIGNALVLLAGMCGDARRAKCVGVVVGGALRALRSVGDNGAQQQQQQQALVPMLLQLLFAWAYHGRALVRPFAVELLHHVALPLMRRREPSVRLGATKLLGALLSNDASDELVGGDDGVRQIVAALHFVANDAAVSDAATIQLAGQLSHAFEFQIN